VDYTAWITSTLTDYITEDNKEDTNITYQPSVRHKENANCHIHKVFRIVTKCVCLHRRTGGKKRLDLNIQFLHRLIFRSGDEFYYIYIYMYCLEQDPFLNADSRAASL
jgi:hypothetical protein